MDPVGNISFDIPVSSAYTVQQELPRLRTLCEDIHLTFLPHLRGKTRVIVEGTRSQVERTVDAVWKVVEVRGGRAYNWYCHVQQLCFVYIPVYLDIPDYRADDVL